MTRCPFATVAVPGPATPGAGGFLPGRGFPPVSTAPGRRPLIGEPVDTGERLVVAPPDHLPGVDTQGVAKDRERDEGHRAAAAFPVTQDGRAVADAARREDLGPGPAARPALR